MTTVSQNVKITLLLARFEEMCTHVPILCQPAIEVNSTTKPMFKLLRGLGMVGTATLCFSDPSTDKLIQVAYYIRVPE